MTNGNGPNNKHSYPANVGDRFSVTTKDSPRIIKLTCPDGSEVSITLPIGGSIDVTVGTNPPIFSIHDVPGDQSIRVVDD